MGIIKYFKSYFLRGLAVLVPTILTLWIFIWGYKFIQENISIFVNKGIVWLILFLQGESQYVTQKELIEFWIHGWGSIAGFIIALVAVCIVGALLASVVGKTLWRTFEKFIMNTPFLKQVYPYVKQITDFLFIEKKHKKLFSSVVAVEYPREGIWSLGMVTGSGLKKIANSIEKDLITVLIPTSPTPFTGFVIMVPKEKTIDVDITIEEALRFIVSGGVITPSNNKIEATLFNNQAENKQES